jgi:methylmalonyl-CoA/ethylmalonyl-CoA epimerase
LASPHYDLDHVALAARDTAPLLELLTGTANATALWGGYNGGFRPMQVLVGDADDGMKIELLEPWETERNDFLARFLDRNGPGPHHLTFKVPDIVAALDRAREHGYEPVNVNIQNPMWREAFLHPRQSHGTVVQLAESSEQQTTRGEMLARVRAQPVPASLKWWTDPLPPSGPPCILRRVVIGVDDLAAATALYCDVVDGALDENRSAAGTASELVWPGGGRVRLEARPGRAAVDRLEVVGLDRDYELLGVRFTPVA